MNTKSRRALITGIYGQDGSYLAEYLLEQGYLIYGIAQAEINDTTWNRALHDHERVTIKVFDIRDAESMRSVIEVFAPDEIYNLAAVSDLKTAQERPEYTYDVNFIAFEGLVAAASQLNPNVRIFQALSSRILIPNELGVISEISSPGEPKNAYDRAKRDSYEQVVRVYRDKGFFVTSGFLCNHESPRRGERFVTGKIARGVAQIKQGILDHIEVGNVNALRDWSHAKDVVRAMHCIVSSSIPSDFVIGSGKLRSVRDFIDTAFHTINMPLVWSDDDIGVQAHDTDGVLRVCLNSAIFQKDDNPVVADTTKLTTKTLWQPQINFEELVSEMVRSEIEATLQM